VFADGPRARELRSGEKGIARKRLHSRGHDKGVVCAQVSLDQRLPET
jgi:hypothetical protein